VGSGRSQWGEVVEVRCGKTVGRPWSSEIQVCRVIPRGVMVVLILFRGVAAFVVIYFLKEILPVIKEEFGPCLEIEN